MWSECTLIAASCADFKNEDMFIRADLSDLIRKSQYCICAFERKLDGFDDNEDSEVEKGDIKDYSAETEMGQFSSRPIRPFDKENIRENMFDFDVNADDADYELMDLQEELSECLETFKNDPNLAYSNDKGGFFFRKSELEI